MAGSIDWEPTLQRVAELAVPVMADWCSVDILQPDGSLKLTALAHADPAKVEWARELRRRFPDRSRCEDRAIERRSNRDA